MSGRLGTDGRFLETLSTQGLHPGSPTRSFWNGSFPAATIRRKPPSRASSCGMAPWFLTFATKSWATLPRHPDTFQATFLILATKSRSIMRQGSVGSWLHGVACGSRRRARVDAAQRKVQERQIAELKRWEIEPNTMHNGRELRGSPRRGRAVAQKIS